ncbi:saccharopine dehydrogenase [Gorgonomyces haynaldii]|nr:saccharopine dehydrogenase [Gorgonomyces haynaldii]
MEREFDVIVWGATGFTGRLAAEYLLLHSDCKFAIAGRSESKLESVQQELLKLSDRYKDGIPIVLADSNDQESLDKLCARTKVVLTTVGPYWQYGLKLVDSCVRIKTDYVDLTGEPPFIREIVEKYHEQAVKNNVLIVPSCGFDSLPSDLGTFLIANEFKGQNKETKEVKMTIVHMTGGVSGGTIASGMNLVSSMSFSDLYKLSTNADYLVPAVTDSKAHASTSMYYDNDFKKWQAPFFMEATNLRYVRRTNHLLQYGKNFKYTETMSTPGMISAAAVTTGMAVGSVAVATPPTRWVLGKLIPPGSGPDEKTRKNGSFESRLVGYSEPDENGHQLKLGARVVGVQDPGYGETSKMISEAALCLAYNKDKFAKGFNGNFEPVKGGVVTAGSAMGLALIERLRKAGMTWELTKVE